MSEATIKAQIKTILEGVTGIGVVHNYLRRSRSIAEFLALMTLGGKVNGCMITRASASAERETMPTITRAHNFKLTWIYEHNDEIASEKEFQALLDSVFDAFKSNAQLNGTALNSDPIEIEEVDTDEIAKTVYHTAKLSLTVYERVFYS